jgi:PAS domain
VAVNEAWVALCGYTQAEVHHKTLSSILHGPQTNSQIVQTTMDRVMKNVVHANDDDDATTTTTTTTLPSIHVVNYKKNGTSFINHVTISKLLLSDDQPDQQFLVGILEPVHTAPLRMVV